MDIDIQKNIFNKLQELTNDNKENIYKHFSKITESIIIFDIVIYENNIIFIKLCYDQYTHTVKILSNILYKINNNNIITDIFIIFLERYNSKKEFHNILDIIIKQINYDYNIHITKNIIVSQPYEQHNKSSDTKMIIPTMLAYQIIKYKEKQLIEDRVKLQKSFYKISKKDKTHYILLNENEGDYYINIIYQDTEGDMSYLISTNILDRYYPEKDIVIEKITKQIYRYIMPFYIKEDIVKICNDKFISADRA